MAVNAQQKEEFVRRLREVVVNPLIQVRSDYYELKAQYDAQDLGNAITEPEFETITGGLARADMVSTVSLLDTKLAFAGPGELTALHSLKK